MDLENYVGGHAAWIGETPVIPSTAVCLDSEANWRAPNNLHGQFDHVWIYEKELFSNGLSWPILLDEGLRLLGEVGFLIIRLRDNKYGTVFELKSLIARRYGIKSRLEFQQRLECGDIAVVIWLQREALDQYSDNSWTIGILSNGQKSNNVHALVKRVVDLSAGRKLQIIIAGPERPVLPDNVVGSDEFWNVNHQDGLPRIGEKKAWIVDQARNANIAIFHDRYQIADNFFSGFEMFGLDFDYASVCQHYESGLYFPSYVGFKDRAYRWQRPIFDPSYKTLHDGHFINGGLIIVKRGLAININFNHLLLHNEAEDVELGFMLRSHGIVPRMNVYSDAVTVGVPDNYTETFIICGSGAPSVVRPGVRDQIIYMLKKGWNLFPARLKVKVSRTKIYASIQRYLHSD